MVHIQVNHRLRFGQKNLAAIRLNKEGIAVVWNRVSYFRYLDIWGLILFCCGGSSVYCEVLA